MEFLNLIHDELNKGTTENGANCFKTTNDNLLDLFSTIGALRDRPEEEVIQKFYKAFAEDKLLAIKLLFYARDIRAGLGERKVFRVCIKSLAQEYPEIVRKNLQIISEYGRYDDLYALCGTPCEKDAFKCIKAQYKKDIEDMKNGKPISLLAKWMKSINASSLESRKLALKTMTALGLSPKSYRLALSSMREYIDVTERKMSNKDWGKIAYERVPSYAMHKYNLAFCRHDERRFRQFIDSVVKGETKINASTLYPYDIVEKYLYQNRSFNQVLETQWQSLPDYIEGENNILIMADVSGSMYGRPLATSIGLAIYFAERNKGIYHNKFMTFASNPQLVELTDGTLFRKITATKDANWNMNTDLEKALKLILNTAKKNNLPQSELPKSLIIISDMEFDNATYDKDMSFYDSMKLMYNEYGYEIPSMVFWNVNSRRDTYHVTTKHKGVQLVGGQSASVFKSLLEGQNCTATELMLKVLNNERYNIVTI